MVEIREAIVVEGRYDKNTLTQIVKAPILETNGFGILKDKPRLQMFRRVACRRGLVIFTDSDGAGFVIRNYLKGAIPAKYLKHAYIPDVPGKERRKSSPGKEGKLGVEGMTPEVILEALRRSGATFLSEETSAVSGGITKQDFVQWGLSGGADSSLLRKRLQKRLDLPEHLSANALLEALNLLCCREEIAEILQELRTEKETEIRQMPNAYHGEKYD